MGNVMKEIAEEIKEKQDNPDHNAAMEGLADGIIKMKKHAEDIPVF